MAVPPSVVAGITKKKAQYGRFIDTKQWDKLNNVILADGHLSFLATDGSPLTVGKTTLNFRSREAFLSFFKTWFAKAETLHNFGPGEFEWSGDGEDEVLAIFAMEDQLMFPGRMEIRGGGHYHERWVQRDGEWYMKELRLERTYNKITPLVRLSTLLLKCAVFR